jgi:hypothetical protein
MSNEKCCISEALPEPPCQDRSNYDGCAPTIDTGRNKARKILIEELDYGYLVKVGCQTVVIEKSEKLIKILTQYLTDPQATENLYHTGKLL